MVTDSVAPAKLTGAPDLGGAGAQLVALSRSRGPFFAALAALILLPQIFSSFQSHKWGSLGLARVRGGDEPHYLVYLNSVVEDGDLWLGNNYAEVHQGGEQAGIIARNSTLDDHSCWYSRGKKIRWFDYYDVHRWGRDAAGHPKPTPKTGVDPADAPVLESPRNSPGLAVLLAPFVFLARGTTYLEPLAILCCALATLGGALAFRMLARDGTSDEQVVNLATVFAFLGTPVWHYSRALFPEAFVTAFLLGSYAFALTDRSLWIAGACMAGAVFLKPVMVLAAVPLGALLLMRRDWRSLVAFGVPNAVVAGVILAMNQVLYGAVYRMSNEFPLGQPLYSAVALLISPSRGLLSVAPVALFALVGWGALMQARREWWTLLVVCGIQFVMSALFKTWDGGYCYGPRYLVPICPILCLGLLPLLEAKGAEASRLRTATLWVGAFSVLAGAAAAIQYWRAFTHNPFDGWL